MKKIGLKTLSAVVKGAGKEQAAKAIKTIAAISGIDLLLLAYNEMGILKYENEERTGEKFLIYKFLKKLFADNPRPVLFDVGANVGKYSLMLRDAFPEAKIYAFEPNANAFKVFQEKLAEKVECLNLGMGADQKTGKLFTYSNQPSSSHASAFQDMFTHFHKADDLTTIEFKMTTVDRFCKERGIDAIDFLKIDTEGCELQVLKGALEMLSGGRIKVIQFEFGECNVFSRVFLRDFYEVLAGFRMFRLDSQRLIPLPAYEPVNEIFRFQNMVAINKSVSI